MNISEILIGMIIISFLFAALAMLLRIIVGYRLIWHFRRDILNNPIDTLKKILIEENINELDKNAKRYQYYIEFLNRSVVIFLCFSFVGLAIMIILSFFLN